MGAIKSRSPAESDGRISLSISRRYDARSSPVMLPEKSMKTTTADACRTAAGTEGVQPVVRRRACVARTSSEGASRRRDSTLIDRKSTRLNSSHTVISYAVFCLKKKKKNKKTESAEVPTVHGL